MSAPPAAYPEQPPGTQNTYVFTEEETRVLMECRSESFWYRSVPFSTVSMGITQILISKGILTTSTRFGALPKVAFAGFIGYLAGKASYVNVCKEKLMKVENSPLAERLRQAQIPKVQNPNFRAQRPEENVNTIPPVQSYAPATPEPPSNVYSSPYLSRSVDVPFGSSMSESSPTGISDNVALEPDLPEEELRKPSAVTYEELRNKNRGSYDVLTPQSPVRPVPDRTPRKDVKKNKYGDVWEE
ncbi:OCIA domain-containing protein 1 [Gastrophryne carolinensis]